MQARSPRVAGIGQILGLFLASALSLSAQNLSALNNYSVITRGDFDTTSEVEGRTLVGGNFTGQNSVNFGIKLQNKVDKTDPVLRVRGNVVGGNAINLNAGSLQVGGTTNNRKFNYNGGGSQINGSFSDVNIILQDLDMASAALAKLGPNSNVLIPAEQPAAFKFNAAPDSKGLATFSIKGSDLFSNSKVQQIELIANGATDVLINVGGANIDWQYGNMVGLFTQNEWRDNIVWNFYEATTIKFGSHNMMGQVLAPLASVTTSGNIDGSIYANTLKTTSEVHLPGYNGNIPVPVPEPSLAGLGVLGAALLLLRRKRQA